MASAKSIGWRLYGATVVALSWLHYSVISRFGHRSEARAAWLAERRQPALPQAIAARRIWIHAVSAGEAKIAELLRQRLLEQDPGLSVVLSATTHSGFTRVRSIAGQDASFIMPLDTLEAQRRVVRTIKPDLLVLVESEYWPAQFEAAEEAGVPVAIVNATMSERSFGRHSRNPAVARRTLLRASRIYAQDEAIAQRYGALGVPQDRLQVTGNLKLVSTQGEPAADASRIPPTVVFGSVHRDELPVVSAAVADLRRNKPDIRIVLVPRYPGRISRDVLASTFGPDLLVTDGIDGAAAAPFVWVDQMGILTQLYRQATIGVVCGTFASVGGHDLVEPLHAGAVSVYGPDVSRQRALHATLSELNCAVQVGDAAGLVTAIEALLADEARRQAMVDTLRGAVVGAAQRLDQVSMELLEMAQPRR